jgi:hypothetical protein
LIGPRQHSLQGSIRVGERLYKVHVTAVNANRRYAEGRFDVVAGVYADVVDHRLERDLGVDSVLSLSAARSVLRCDRVSGLAAASEYP